MNLRVTLTRQLCRSGNSWDGTSDLPQSAPANLPSTPRTQAQHPTAAASQIQWPVVFLDPTSVPTLNDLPTRKPTIMCARDIGGEAHGEIGIVLCHDKVGAGYRWGQGGHARDPSLHKRQTKNGFHDHLPSRQFMSIASHPEHNQPHCFRHHCSPPPSWRSIHF